MASSRETWVTGLGAITSIGHSAVAAASALRAGIALPRPLTLADIDGGPITGEPVAGFTDGFVQFGLWLRLALGALDDLRAGGLPEAPDFWRRTALVVCLPHLEEERFALPTHDMQGLLRAGFFEPFLELGGIPLQLAQCSAAFGHCAAADGIARLSELFTRDPHLQRVLLLAADSTCDVQSLGWLAANRRLKTAENPVGMIPGEAGAAVLLERSEAAQARGASPLAKVHPANVGVPLGAEAPAAAVGRQLATTVRAASTAAGATGTRDTYVDQNGEPWRAEAWGHALVHLQRQPEHSELQAILPGISLGEIGAASGLLSLTFATRAFARGYAQSRHALVCSVDEHRATAAFVVERA